MNEYTENRFKDYRQLSDEELLKTKKELEGEIADYENDLDDNSISSSEKSEIRNSDLPYAKDKLAYIEMLIESRGLDKKGPAMK